MISDTSYTSNTVTITYGLSLASVSDDDETGKYFTPNTSQLDEISSLI